MASLFFSGKKYTLGLNLYDFKEWFKKRHHIYLEGKDESSKGSRATDAFTVSLTISSYLVVGVAHIHKSDSSM